MFINKKFDLNLDKKIGAISVCSPSNIALIKYWGKHGIQLPCNPSLSITLNNAHTKTTIKYKLKDSCLQDQVDLDFFFEDKQNQKFKDKIVNFFNSVKKYFPFIGKYHFTIHSYNTFPHSSGIASSASSMSALAFALVEIEKELSEILFDDSNYYLNKSSFVARLGSGSACRSLHSCMSLWGRYELVAESSDEYGIEYLDFHENFKNIHDSIAIISKSEKSVSSRAGHALMVEHPFAQVRFSNAVNNLKKILTSLKSGDFKSFCEIVESEALELHGLMMNSNPSYILMEPNTLEVIRRIRNYRNNSNSKICFTLDAGANVHILYLDQCALEVKKFLECEISPLCVDGLIVHDQMGKGTRRVDA